MYRCLQVGYVTGCRGFFEALGVKWLDPPLNEEGLLECHKQLRCTCGACANGELCPAALMHPVMAL